jgi:GTPase SAR1 family protein
MDNGREDLLRKITEIIATFSRRIEVLSSQNENSINILAESIFSRILNVLLDLNLTNANYAKTSNNPAVDLIDIKSKVAFQVSASSNNKKILDTLTSFNTHKLYKNYSTLYFFFTTKKQKLQINDKIESEISLIKNKETSFSFNYAENIIFFDDIYLLLKKKDNIETEKLIYDILEEELTSLSRLANRLNISEDPIYVTFSNDNLEFGAKVIEGLLQRKFVVYHDNASVRFFEQFEKYQERLFLVSGINTPIKKCVVLFSKDFFKDKYHYNKILNNAIDSNAQILSYATPDFNNSIPAHINIGLTYDVVKVKNFDFQTVIQDINSKFSISTELDENPKIFKKFTQIIKSAYPNHIISQIHQHNTFGFELYECNDPRFKKSLFFICFHHNARIEKSYEHIKEKHPQILAESNFMILVPRESSLKSSNRRLELFKIAFKAQNVKFLEDFLLECTPEKFRSTYTPFAIHDYIEPYLSDVSNANIEFNWFYKWFNHQNKPITVIRGLGGVGKTTLVQKLSDEFVKQKPDSTVIYIDSKDILEELQEIHDSKHVFDLFVFYEATISKLSKKGIDSNLGLDNELFRLVLDSGNILMIIDGLDEVIANLPQFDVKAFLKSIYYYSEDFGKSKVMITCRDYFWKKSINEEENPFLEDEDIDLNFSTILLQPFDESQAKLFFEKKHPLNNRRVTKSIQLAKAFIDGDGQNGSNKFIPFVLRIVDTMLETNEDIDIDHESTFNSKYLYKTSKTDTITYNICVREKDRIGQIETDDQIKLFMKFAVDNYASSKPRAALCDFDEFAKTINSFYTQSARDSFKAHPLLIIDEKEDIYFRYDFLAEYFKSIHITNVLINYNEKTHIDDKLIIILSNHAKLNNGFIREIYYRISSKKSLVEENIFSLIASIEIYDESDVSPEQKQRAISGLLAIAITLKNNLSKPDTKKNTELLETYFGDSDGRLNNLYISDFNAYDNSMKTIFDFKGKTLVNCCFDNYEYFWECKFDEKTLFKKCVFKNSKFPKTKEIGLSVTNFEDCPMDEIMKQMIHSNRNINSDINYKIENEIKEFFKNFIWSGQPGIVSIKNNLTHQFRGSLIEVKKLLNYLSDRNILEFPELSTGNLDRVRISRMYFYEIKTFCMEGLKSKSISALLNDLKKHFNL